MNRRIAKNSIIVALSIAASFVPELRGAPVEFTVDTSQSKIALSGSIMGFPLKEQGPGSLVTSFYGKILAEVTSDGIRFPGGSAVAARTNGVWAPGPKGSSTSAPADYAAQASTLIFTVKGALRDIQLDLTSGILPISNGRFDASSLLFAFPTNATASFDYDAGLLVGTGGVALTGVSTNKIVNGATLDTSSDPQTLTISVDTEFKFKAFTPDDSVVHLTGTLVAKAVAQPLITSIEVRDQSVILHVQGTSPSPGLFSSPDLKQWATRTPTQSMDTNGVVLTLPLGGAREFYRVSK
jgi:hypothetical protein